MKVFEFSKYKQKKLSSAKEHAGERGSNKRGRNEKFKELAYLMRPENYIQPKKDEPEENSYFPDMPDIEATPASSELTEETVQRPLNTVGIFRGLIKFLFFPLGLVVFILIFLKLLMNASY